MPLFQQASFNGANFRQTLQDRPTLLFFVSGSKRNISGKNSAIGDRSLSRTAGKPSYLKACANRNSRKTEKQDRSKELSKPVLVVNS
jgi:hypothetical protein